MSWRRFVSLFRQLPEDSRTVTVLLAAQRDQPRPEPDPNVEEPIPAWGQTEHLLAAAIDAIRDLQWQVVTALSKNPPDRPKQYPRPTDRRRRATTPRARLEQFRALERLVMAAPEGSDDAGTPPQRQLD